MELWYEIYYQAVAGEPDYVLWNWGVRGGVELQHYDVEVCLTRVWRLWATSFLNSVTLTKGGIKKRINFVIYTNSFIIIIIIIIIIKYRNL
jgi:hypothetical protein